MDARLARWEKRAEKPKGKRALAEEGRGRPCLASPINPSEKAKLEMDNFEMQSVSSHGLFRIIRPRRA